ncbi:hypothetical protein TSUD_70670 [Trifolium subterraneum]|uniref:Magnesium transporter n=1 Tax=Trifolium subterraneum TaxID=3900 RepID=A0A2Z6LZ96_TRISU|nr:hypothetical protein TSUD_70670 [Trifolium subterraneum]
MARVRSIVEEEEKGKLVSTMIGGYRRKAIVTLVKTWMVVSAETGEARVEDVDKHSIMRRTGLPARDLRALDPHLSNPSSILGRERAIVVNLEHIKAIITSTEVLMINSSNPFFLRFLQDLQARVPPSDDVKTRKQISNDAVDSDCEKKPLLDEKTHEDSSNNVAAAPKPLPFEFKALEACIESACTCLEYETQKLEEEAYPALDELTAEISTLNLEHVRQIKNRLVALSGRVQKVADQLEHLLDDDYDMAEMYLTQKLDDGLLDQTSLKEGYNSTYDENINERDESDSDDKSYDSKPDVEELEMLLEAYFAQINGILQKLLSVDE